MVMGSQVLIIGLLAARGAHMSEWMFENMRALAYFFTSEFCLFVWRFNSVEKYI